LATSRLAVGGGNRYGLLTAICWRFTLLYVGLGIIYLFLLFFLGFRTFQNRHWVLLILGFVIPFLWIAGAMLPPKGMSHMDELYAQRDETD
jgi:hypothetical protein